MRITPTDVRVPAATVRAVQYSHRLTEIRVEDRGAELDSEQLAEELLGYVDILLARADAPVESPYLDLAEAATAYLARALEMEMIIHNLERNREIVRGHPLYKFRTGTLRSFIEMAKKMAELGSRRLTAEQLINDQRFDSGDY